MRLNGPVMTELPEKNHFRDSLSPLGRGLG
ncbi:protein of unknown function (plasmid) [Azospirillum baldaniorum]|uniref:Uncharacterized protein n=1 Tax=Azospirillum baldaniorum TaxID=1064539 RepID=A0A9P1JVV0_9PROT|nr:protein of unknown function [Azospirillum baldaniorum]